jgi:ABC-type phosphate/phosphonate transport system substrate-binding protein
MQLGVGFENGNIVLSLSPTRCLFMDERKDARTLKAQRHHVILFNEHIMAGAHEAVYASVKSRDIEAAFNKTVPGENTAVTILDAEQYK